LSLRAADTPALHFSLHDALPILGASDHVQVDREFPQGVVALRSLRSPEKDTPNEDAAAIIWLSDNALVLAVADGVGGTPAGRERSEEHTSELQSRENLVCRLLLE